MAENHTCPRRIETGMDSEESPFVGAGTNLDSYSSGHGLSGQASGCSYCGSMPPDDFMQAVRDGKEVGPTDKSYKFYVDDHRGKFYTQHLSEEQGWEFHQLWQDGKINWGYPGKPYVRLFIPGPSTATQAEKEQMMTENTPDETQAAEPMESAPDASQAAQPTENVPEEPDDSLD